MTGGVLDILNAVKAQHLRFDLISFNIYSTPICIRSNTHIPTWLLIGCRRDLGGIVSTLRACLRACGWGRWWGRLPGCFRGALRCWAGSRRSRAVYAEPVIFSTSCSRTAQDTHTRAFPHGDLVRAVNHHGARLFAMLQGGKKGSVAGHGARDTCRHGQIALMPLRPDMQSSAFHLTSSTWECAR